jgi:polar amino acid transport system permease protein
MAPRRTLLPFETGSASMYQWDFSFIWSYRWLFVNGTIVTLLFTFGIVVLGLAVGLLSGLVRLSRFAPLRWLSQAYVEVFRCTPVLVQLVWFYYALPILSGIEMSATTAGILALSLYGGAFYSEIIRGGIASIEPGQTEAALALGMTPTQSMRRIVLPQALKRMVPPLMNQSIIQLKNTSLVSVLAVPDLLYQGQAVAHDSYRPLEIYTLVAVIYFVILFPLTLLVGRLERRLARAD